MLALLSIALGLVSMFGYALVNAFSQPLTKQLGPAQVLFLRSFTICAVLLVLSVPSFGQPHSVWAVLATVALGAVGYLPVLAFMHGLKISRIGVIAPIAGTSPLITVVLSAVFLGAVLNVWQWLAVVAVVMANVVVSIDFKNWRDSNVFKLSSGIPYALLAAVGWGVFFFLLVPLARELGATLATLLVELGVMLAAGLHIWVSRLPVALSDVKKPAVMANGLLICIATLAFAVGVRYFNVGIVAALSNSTALVAALLGVYLFGERLTRIEKISGAVMVTGVVVIALA